MVLVVVYLHLATYFSGNLSFEVLLPSAFDEGNGNSIFLSGHVCTHGQVLV